MSDATRPDISFLAAKVAEKTRNLALETAHHDAYIRSKRAVGSEPQIGFSIPKLMANLELTAAKRTLAKARQ